MTDLEPRRSSLIEFINTGQLRFIGIGCSLNYLLTLIKYKEENDVGRFYPSLKHNELFDHSIRFMFRNDIVDIITIYLDEDRLEPQEAYGISWYQYAKGLNFDDFEQLLRSEGILYWKVLSIIDDEVLDTSIQTKGIPSVIIQFFESGLISDITYSKEGIEHYNSRYKRLIDPD